MLLIQIHKWIKFIDIQFNIWWLREKVSYLTEELFPYLRTEGTALMLSALSALPSSHLFSSFLPSSTTVQVTYHSLSRHQISIFRILKPNWYCLQHWGNQFLWFSQCILDRNCDCIGTRTVVDGSCTHRPQICPQDSTHCCSCMLDSSRRDNPGSQFSVKIY